MKLLGRLQSVRHGDAPRAGFTLAEVVVALLIVSMTLLLILQGLSTAKLTAAHASNRKIARDLALLTLGWAQGGLFWDDLDGLPGTLSGNFAEEGYEAFVWELAVGQDGLSNRDDEGDSPYFDSVAYERQRREETDEGREDAEPYAETGSTGAPYEVVSVRVTFPKLAEQDNTVELERWIPLGQIFGRPDGQPIAPTEESE